MTFRCVRRRLKYVLLMNH